MDNGTVTIRKATENHRNSIAYVFADAFYNDWKMMHKDLKVIVKALADGLNIECYHVAEIDGEVVGFITAVEKGNRAFSVPLESFKKHFGAFKGGVIGRILKREFNESLDLADDIVYIDILGVGKKVQGYGVGTKLIKYLVSVMDKKQFILTVTNVNKGAIRCYEKNGFDEYDRKAKGLAKMVYMKLDKS